MSVPRRTSRYLLPFLGLALLASAQSPPPPAPAPGDAGAAGMRAFVDPATGRLTQSPPEGVEAAGPVPAEADRLSRRSSDLVEVDLGAAGVQVDLEGRFATATVATLGPDGGLSISCERAGAATAGNREADDDR